MGRTLLSAFDFGFLAFELSLGLCRKSSGEAAKG